MVISIAMLVYQRVPHLKYKRGQLMMNFGVGISTNKIQQVMVFSPMLGHWRLRYIKEIQRAQREALPECKKQTPGCRLHQPFLKAMELMGSSGWRAVNYFHLVVGSKRMIERVECQSLFHLGYAAGRIITQTLSNMFQKFKSVPTQEAFGMFWMVFRWFFGCFGIPVAFKNGILVMARGLAWPWIA